MRLLPKFSRRTSGDLFHLNDVEALSNSIADQYPLFETGDLLISLRDLHLVFVMDPITEIVKWYTTATPGPGPTDALSHPFRTLARP